MPPDVGERLFQSQNQVLRNHSPLAHVPTEKFQSLNLHRLGALLCYTASVWKRERSVTHLFFIYFIFCILSWPEHCTNRQQNAGFHTWRLLGSLCSVATEGIPNSSHVSYEWSRPQICHEYYKNNPSVQDTKWELRKTAFKCTQKMSLQIYWLICFYFLRQWLDYRFQ